MATKLRLVTNKGLQMLGDATGEDVIVFSRAYLSDETFTEEQIYSMTVATGTMYTDRINASLLNGEYIVSATFTETSPSIKSVILCGRLKTQAENVFTPICVYTSDSSLGMNGTESSITFRLNFTSENGDDIIDVGDGQSMSRGEIIAYINQVISESLSNDGNEVMTLGTDQTAKGSKTFTKPLLATALHAPDVGDMGITMNTDERTTVIKGGTDPCGGYGAKVTVGDYSVDIECEDLLIPFNGQQRSLQNILNGIVDAQGQNGNTGSLRHAIYYLSEEIDPSFGLINPNLHIVRQEEKAGDQSLSGTCFLAKNGYVYAVICLGTADKSEWVVRSNQFGTQTFKVSVLTRDASSYEISKRSFNAEFAWHDSNESLLGRDLYLQQTLPCLANGSRCALCAMIPMGDDFQGAHVVYEIGISNDVVGGGDISEDAIDNIITPISNQIELITERVDSLSEMQDMVASLEDRVMNIENALDPCGGGFHDYTQEIADLNNRMSSVEMMNRSLNTNLNALQQRVSQLEQNGGGQGGGGEIDQNVIRSMKANIRAIQDDMNSLQSRYQETTLWSPSTFAVLLCAKEPDGNISHSFVYTNSDRVITYAFTPRVDFEEGSVSGAGISLKMTYPCGIFRVGTRTVPLKNLPLAMCIEYELTTDDHVVECHSVFNLTATNSPTVVFESALQPLIDIPWKIACIRFMEAHLPYTNRDMGSLGYVKDYEGDL